MRLRSVLCLVVSVVIGLFFIVSCRRQSEVTVPELTSFYVTNQETVGGQMRQVICVTNGLTLYFTQSYLAVRFNKDADILVQFDPDDLNPTLVELTTAPLADQPAQNVVDLNADGVPDARVLRDGSRKIRQIFYQGQWFSRSERGSNFISIHGEDVRMRFDGRRWVNADGTNNARVHEQ